MSAPVQHHNAPNVAESRRSRRSASLRVWRRLRRPRSASLACGAGALLAAAAAPPLAVAAEPLSTEKPSPQVKAPAAADVVPGRFLVTYEPSAGAQARAQALASVDGERVRDRIATLDVAVLELPAADRADTVRTLRADPAVASVEPDIRMRAFYVDCRSNVACAVPTDPGFKYQWGLQNDPATVHFTTPFVLGADIAAPLAWKRTRGSSSTRVAVLDSGVTVGHQDLAGRVRLSASAFRDGGVDVDGHGTHVAGIIGATPDNGVGVAGVAPLAGLLNVKTLDDNGATSCSIAADAIVFATQQDAEVINASFGATSYCATLERAVNYAWDNDTLVIAAAGNSGKDEPVYPAALANALSVAATDNRDVRADFSNYGRWVNMAAPGQDILSTTPDGYDIASGTSQAAPYVSGVAALIWSSVPDADGDGYRSDDVAGRLLTYTDAIAGSGTQWLSGRLNACRALTADTGACPPGAPTPAIPAAPAPPPAPAPAPPAPATTPPAPPATDPGPSRTVLTKGAARSAANRALTRRYKRRWTKGRAKRIDCRVAAGSPKGRCRVVWRSGRQRYAGVVHVEARVDGSPRTRIAVRRRR